MPGSAVRAAVISILYIPFVFILGIITASLLQGQISELGVAIYFVVFMFGGFFFPVIAVLVLTYIGYRRRKYEIGDDGITERRGLVFRREKFIPYDDIEEVSLRQSTLQSFYGVGTIRINDVDASSVDAEDEMRIRFVEHPQSVYTNIHRKKADVTGSAADIEPPTVGELPSESEELSRFSSDRLAAGTGFRNLMPVAILHPVAWASIQAGVVHSGKYVIPLLVVLYYGKSIVQGLLAEIGGLAFLTTDLFYWAITGLALFFCIAIVCGVTYWQYDRWYYELYTDHIRAMVDSETKTITLSDVAEVKSVPKSGDVGHVSLIGDDRDEIFRLDYLEQSEEVGAYIEKLIAHGKEEMKEPAE